MYERIDINKYKGALIEYKCAKCHPIPKMFFESFQSQIARIKSDSCSHMSFKFISNFDGKNFKYIVSLNCLNCGENKIKNLFDKDSEYSSNIEYKCEKCGNGDMKFGILLSEEIIEMDENNNDENQNENKNKMNQNNNNNNNNMNQNPYINNNNNNIIYNNFIAGNNYNQGFGVKLAGGYNMIVNKIILNFCDMRGRQYQIETSPDVPFAEVIRNLLNKYPAIDRENIASFVCNGNRVKNQKTVKENGISSGDKVMIHFRNK